MIIALLAVTILVVSAARPDDVSTLRARGQLAVDDLHAKWAAASPEAREELSKTLDQVCAQKDCHASRLYWYTDLEQAKAEAQRTGRPILALHLLGRLDEELSCANSRFFRTLLYSDDSISKLLREHFVLYWHSVREVPRVTIELGDGRVIRQTIAGNSAHYLLDANGAPLDVLPGLYSPAAFRDQLERWVTLHRTLTPETLLAYHSERLRLTSARATELGLDVTMYPGQQPAWNAQRQAQTKAVTEVRVLRQVKPGERAVARQMEQLFVIGEQGKRDVQFSESTLQLMSSKQELTEQVLDNLRRTVAADTVFNEYELHRRAHQWFLNEELGDLVSLNERVYDELFQTPSSDPWLGLQPDTVFTGIEQPKARMTGGG
ncbi:MAG: hypothetical protein ACJ74H_02840 [Thermoanaerobaculia bacterium]